jgi:hypothetical protein
MDRDGNLRVFREFVDLSRWKFAKTYVESYPHEYTLERPEAPESFRVGILCIERWGVIESFWRTERRYLYLDGRKYWHMGDVNAVDAEDRPTLINRTWVDVSGYREDAARLGYGGADLDRLVRKWNRLLDEAHKG